MIQMLTRAIHASEDQLRIFQLKFGKPIKELRIEGEKDGELFEGIIRDMEARDINFF